MKKKHKVPIPLNYFTMLADDKHAAVYKVVSKNY